MKNRMKKRKYNKLVRDRIPNILIIEVFLAILNTYNISAATLLTAAAAKREKFDKFDNHIFLEWVEDKKEK